MASLNRPGGNITGMSIYPSEIAAKSVQLLKELLPTATVIGYLVNPMNPTAVEVYTKEASSAAGALGITIQVLNASTEHDLEEAFASSSHLAISASYGEDVRPSYGLLAPLWMVATASSRLSKFRQRGWCRKLHGKGETQ